MDALDDRVRGRDQLHAGSDGYRRAVASRAEANAVSTRKWLQECGDEVEFRAQLRGISSALPGGSMGTISVNVDPLPSSLFNDTSPPCASM